VIVDHPAGDAAGDVAKLVIERERFPGTISVKSVLTPNFVKKEL
jgi:hypothetical protein